MDTCTNCRGTGSILFGSHPAPCPYCRPTAARRWSECQPSDYDPREDADSELVGNPPEEER